MRFVSEPDEPDFFNQMRAGRFPLHTLLGAYP